MQTFPEPPRSYSLIENLRPSVSLSGETSQLDQNLDHQLKLRSEITNELNQIIDAVQTSKIDDLKRTLRTEINEIQKLNINELQPSSVPFISISESEDLVLSKLKQLAIISDILVQRMNEKYSESKTLFEEFYKQTIYEKRMIGCKIMNQKLQKKREDKKERKMDVSQETEKKPMGLSEGKQEQVDISDQKRTRKQDTQGKGKLK